MNPKRLKNLNKTIYLVNIDTAYWEIGYPGFETKTPDDQLSIKLSVYDEIEFALKSNRNPLIIFIPSFHKPLLSIKVINGKKRPKIVIKSNPAQ